MTRKESKTISKPCRFSETEYAQIKRNASQENMTVSALIRERSLISSEESRLTKDMIERNAKCELLNHILTLNISTTAKKLILKECSI